MEDENLVRVIIQNKVHVLPSVSTFQELRLAILTDFRLLTLNFLADDLTPSLRISPKSFKRIEAIIEENYTYEAHGKKGNCFRCTYCKRSLSTINFTCRHDSKCRNSSMRQKHSLLSETLSSIDKITDSEKNDSSFLSISKTDTKNTENWQKNSSLCITQDSSNAHQDISEVEEKE